MSAKQPCMIMSDKADTMKTRQGVCASRAMIQRPLSSFGWQRTALLVALGLSMLVSRTNGARCMLRGAGHVRCSEFGLQNNIGTIFTSADTYYLDVTSIDFSGNNITAVDATELSNLPRVQELDFSDCRISSFNDAANAWTLPNLTTLRLDNNVIPELTFYQFRGLSTLQTLYLYRNRITMVYANAFADLTSLVTLSLSYNRIDDIYFQAFRPLVSMQSLHLISNKLARIQTNHFRNMSALENLNLQFNEITSFGQHSFAGLTRLVQLRLQYNNITSIQPSLLRDLTSLTALRIHHNLLTALGNETFENLSLLRSLELNHNFLTSLFPVVLQPLHAISTIDLSYNSLPVFVVDEWSTLIRLELGNNVITEITLPSTISLTNLQTLLLNNNYLSDIPDHIDHLLGLEKLDLSGNIFVGTVSPLTLSGLLDLDLSYNSLTMIPSNIVSSIQSLNFAFNNLTQLPDAWVEGYDSLVNLTLQGNQIERFTRHSIQVYALQHLDLSRNRLNNIVSGTFEDLTSLVSLNVSHNNISNIGEQSFPFNSSQLTSMDFSHNRIAQLADQGFSIFRFLPALQTLNLAHNEISDLNVLNLSSVEYLNLEYNQLSIIVNNTFAEMPRLKMLLLAYNNVTMLQADSFIGLFELISLSLAANEIEIIAEGLFESSVDLNELSFSTNKITMLSTSAFNSMQPIQIDWGYENSLQCDPTHLWPYIVCTSCSNSLFFVNDCDRVYSCVESSLSPTLVRTCAPTELSTAAPSIHPTISAPSHFPSISAPTSGPTLSPSQGPTLPTLIVFPTDLPTTSPIDHSESSTNTTTPTSLVTDVAGDGGGGGNSSPVIIIIAVITVILVVVIVAVILFQRRVAKGSNDPSYSDPNTIAMTANPMFAPPVYDVLDYSEIGAASKSQSQNPKAIVSRDAEGYVAPDTIVANPNSLPREDQYAVFKDAPIVFENGQSSKAVNGGATYVEPVTLNAAYIESQNGSDVTAIVSPGMYEEPTRDSGAENDERSSHYEEPVSIAIEGAYEESV